MDIKTHCIVLRTVKYGDNKLIIDLLTREGGRLSAAYKITTSRTSKVKKQFFQPLTILDADIVIQPHQKLAQIKDARLLSPYTSIPFDGIKMSISFFIAEFLCYATRDLHSDSLLFDFVEQSLMWLDASEPLSIGVANFHIMFMMRMSLFLGFYPDMSSYAEGCFFDLRDGCFCSAAPMHRDFLSAEDAKKMQTLMRMTPSNLHLFPLSHIDRNRIIDFCLTYYRLHIPAFGELKSLDILRSL